MLCVSNQLTDLPVRLCLEHPAGWEEAAALSQTLMTLFLALTLRRQKSKFWNQQRKLKAVYLMQLDALMMFASYTLWHMLDQQSPFSFNNEF